MNELVKLTIDAHGGLEQWNKFSTLSAHLIQDGMFWGAKGQGGVLHDVTVTIDLRSEKASHYPFGSPDRRSRFEPQRVALEDSKGRVVEELVHPHNSFEGHKLETPWTKLQLAYFAGEAMWTYLSLPFLLARPGIESTEVEPWREAGETWRRLEVHFPSEITTHSAKQTLYVDTKGMLRRHDYDVDIAGKTTATLYTSNPVVVSGIVFPTKRLVYPRLPDNRVASEPLIVSIDLDHIVLG